MRECPGERKDSAPWRSDPDAAQQVRVLQTRVAPTRKIDDV
jgi:hypothetical protein